MTEKKRELIKTIAVIPSNFEYIAKTGIINGTLLVEIERVMEAYAAQQKSEIKMPTEEEMKKRQKDRGDYLREMGYPPQVESLINQEVEKRISERMPSDEEVQIAQSEYENEEMEYGRRVSPTYCFKDFMAGADWLRSRLTNPGANSSQKTEGEAKKL